MSTESEACRFRTYDLLHRFNVEVGMYYMQVS